MIEQTDAAALKQELALLSESFKGQLAAMMRTVQSCRDQIRACDKGTTPSAVALERLFTVVHRISGSAGSFGYQALSRAAAPLDTLLSGIRSSGIPPESEQCDQINTFLSILIRTWEESEAEPLSLLEDADEEEDIDNHHLVYLIETDLDLADFIVQQLTQFDYEVRVFTAIAELQAAVAKARPAAIISSFLLPEGAFTGAKRLGDFTQGIPVILLSKRPDIEARLAAVQAGCAAYLVKPVETNDLVDWLNRLTQNTPSRPHRILIVDDDRHLAESYALVLQLAGMKTAVLTESLRILETIVDYHPDLILMDVYMPECSGIELARVVRQQRTYLSIPIVFLSVENDINRQLEAKRSGGDDFLTKPIEPDHLVLAVLSRAERARDLRAVMESDSLTGLLSHVFIKERLAVELKRAQRQGTHLSFALIDLDHFKSVNDRYGHLTGDRVIKALASLLTRRLRNTDVIGRYGGEEFAVILTETAVDPAIKVMNEVRQSFALLRHASGEQEFSVSLSCGVAAFTGTEDSAGLIAAADQALYAAKAAGRNRVIKGTADA